MKRSFYFILLCIFLYVFSLSAFASELDPDASEVVLEASSDDVSDNEPGVYYVSVYNETTDYTEILESIAANTVSSNDMLSDIQLSIHADDEYKDLSLYESLDEFESSDLYVNRVEYEFLKMFRSLIILQAVTAGLTLVSIFLWRSKKRGNS